MYLRDKMCKLLKNFPIQGRGVGFSVCRGGVQKGVRRNIWGVETPSKLCWDKPEIKSGMCRDWLSVVGTSTTGIYWWMACTGDWTDLNHMAWYYKSPQGVACPKPHGQV